MAWISGDKAGRGLSLCMIIARVLQRKYEKNKDRRKRTRIDCQSLLSQRKGGVLGTVGTSG